MNFLALLGWSYDDKTTIMSPAELVERFSLDRVVAEPGDVRLREARLDERRPPAGAARGRVRARRCSRGCASRGSTGRRRRCARRCRSCRRSSRSSRAYPDYVRFLFEPVAPDGADPEIVPRRSRGARRARAVGDAARSRRRCARSPTASARSRARRSRRSASRSRARRSRPGCSRASSCSGATSRSRGCALPASGGTRAPSCRPRSSPRPRPATARPWRRRRTSPRRRRSSASAVSGAAQAARRARARAGGRAAASRRAAAARAARGRARRAIPRRAARRPRRPSRRPPRRRAPVASRAPASAAASSVCTGSVPAGGESPKACSLARVQPVLQPAQHARPASRPRAARARRRSPRAASSVCGEAGPERADLGCVALPGPRPRSHGCILTRRPSRIERLTTIAAP